MTPDELLDQIEAWHAQWGEVDQDQVELDQLCLWEDLGRILARRRRIRERAAIARGAYILRQGEP